MQLTADNSTVKQPTVSGTFSCGLLSQQACWQSQSNQYDHGVRTGCSGHVSLHKQTNKQSNRQTDRQTNRQTDKQTDKQTKKQTNQQTNKQANKQTNKQTSQVWQAMCIPRSGRLQTCFLSCPAAAIEACCQACMSFSLLSFS